jgi:hypothetical protein
LSAQRPPTALFVLLNVALVWPVIGLVLGVSRTVWMLYAWALLIILIQAALYGRTRRFAWRLLLFYGGFVLFCWGLTLRLDGQAVSDLRDLAGLALRGVAFVLFGHLYGFVLLVPVIAGINEWAWRRMVTA